MKSSSRKFKNYFPLGAKILALVLAVTGTTLYVTWAAAGASTVIGTNISTNGTLTAGGLATLNGGILANSSSSTITNLSVVNATSTYSTTTFLAITGTATSTFAGGVNLSNGCFSINGACLGGGGLTSLNGLLGSVQTFSTSSNGLAILTIISSGTDHAF